MAALKSLTRAARPLARPAMRRLATVARPPTLVTDATDAARTEGPVTGYAVVRGQLVKLVAPSLEQLRQDLIAMAGHEDRSDTVHMLYIAGLLGLAAGTVFASIRWSV
jgi:hypothetical protein